MEIKAITEGKPDARLAALDASFLPGHPEGGAARMPDLFAPGRPLGIAAADQCVGTPDNHPIPA